MRFLLPVCALLFLRVVYARRGPEPRPRSLYDGRDSKNWCMNDIYWARCFLQPLTGDRWLKGGGVGSLSGISLPSRWRLSSCRLSLGCVLMTTPQFLHLPFARCLVLKTNASPPRIPAWPAFFGLISFFAKICLPRFTTLVASASFPHFIATLRYADHQPTRAQRTSPN